jgi:hypothetical protein
MACFPVVGQHRQFSHRARDHPAALMVRGGRDPMVPKPSRFPFPKLPMNRPAKSPSNASTGIRRVNWGLVLARATALAASRGREAHEVSRQDWDEASAAITGQVDARSAPPAAKAGKDVDSGVACPAFIGSKTFVDSGEDVDDPESTDRERLFNQGVVDAELGLEARKQEEQADPGK